MDAPSLQQLLDAIKTELVAGNKIAAIKLYRDATGAGLAEAKEAVELIASGRPPASGAAATPSADAMQEVQTLVAAGRKIEAVKVYRSAVGVGLKEAKDAVDALEARLNPTAVRARAETGRRIRLVVVALVAAAAAVVAYLLTRPWG